MRSAQKGRNQQLDFCNCVCAINRQNYDPCQYGTPSLNISPVIYLYRRLKVYSSHLNWGARLYSIDLLLNTRCPASFKNFF
jgi:hypothetical protein